MERCYPFFVFFLLAQMVAAHPDTTFSEHRMYVHYAFRVKCYDDQHTLLYNQRKETFFTRGYIRYYDADGNVTRRGHQKLHHQQGRWVYTENGKDSILHFRYGINRERIRAADHADLILTYGMIPKKGVDRSHRIIYAPVSTCVVSGKILFVTGVHNSVVRCKKRLRYGKDWKKSF